MLVNLHVCITQGPRVPSASFHGPHGGVGAFFSADLESSLGLTGNATAQLTMHLGPAKTSELGSWQQVSRLMPSPHLEGIRVMESSPSSRGRQIERL